MTALALLAGLWVLLAAVWLAAWPLLGRHRPPVPVDLLELRDLEAEKARLMGEIHDLELDWQTGKLAEADYRDLEARLKSRAVAVMAEIEQRSGAAPAAEPVPIPDRSP